MALKKACCPHCYSKSHRVTVFDAQSENKYCFCPKCREQILTSDAIKNYTVVSKKLMRQANTLMYDLISPHKAYHSYGNILSDDPSNFYARYGRIIALICMSTVRESTFKQACELFESEADSNLAKLYSEDAYLKFVHRVLTSFDVYFTRLKRRLRIRGHFFDLNCIGLFVTRMEEMSLFLSALKRHFLSFEKKLDGPEAQKFYGRLEHDLIKYQSYLVLNYKYTACDGKVYLFMKFDNKNHTPCFVEDKYMINTFLSKIKLPSLTKKKGYRYINNVIFYNRAFMVYYAKCGWIITLLMLALALSIGLSLAAIKSDPTHITLLMITIFASVLCFLLFVIWCVEKRRLHSHRSTLLHFKK